MKMDEETLATVAARGASCAKRFCPEIHDRLPDQGLRDLNTLVLRDVPALVAEVRRLRQEMLKALRESGCNGDLCAHEWHETFRTILGEERFQ